jgi:hypothetical protein
VSQPTALSSAPGDKLQFFIQYCDPSGSGSSAHRTAEHWLVYPSQIYIPVWSPFSFVTYKNKLRGSWSAAACRQILVPSLEDRGESRGQRGGSYTAVNLSFLDRSHYILFQVAPHLSSRG